MLVCEVSENRPQGCSFQSRFSCQHFLMFVGYGLAFWQFLNVSAASIYLTFPFDFCGFCDLRLLQKLDSWFATQVWLNSFTAGCRETGSVVFDGIVRIKWFASFKLFLEELIIFIQLFFRLVDFYQSQYFMSLFGFK